MSEVPSTTIQGLTNQPSEFSMRMFLEALVNFLAHEKVKEPGIALNQSMKAEGSKLIAVFDVMSFPWEDTKNGMSLNGAWVAAKLKKILEGFEMEGGEVRPISVSTPKLQIIMPLEREVVSKLSAACDQVMECIAEDFKTKLANGRAITEVKQSIINLREKVPDEFLTAHLSKLFDRFPEEFSDLQMSLQSEKPPLSERFEQPRSNLGII